MNVQDGNEHLLKIRKWILYQIVLSFIFVLTVAIVQRNKIDFISAIFATMVVLIPNLTCYIVAYRGDSLKKTSIAIFKQHKQAMVAKFLMNICMFALVFIFFKGCNIVILFIGVFILYLSNLLRLMV